jgi:hypothetical protein
VANAADKRDIVLRTKRALHAWRVRLLSRRAAVALLLLFTLGLGEPLLCIIHCQIWLPLAFHSYFAAQHAHAHGHAHPAAAPTAQPAQQAVGATITSPIPSEHTTCAFQGGSEYGSVPFHVPPSPVHDMLPALVVLMLLVALIGMRPAAPPGDPPNISHPPRLRPPIPFAA